MILSIPSTVVTVEESTSSDEENDEDDENDLIGRRGKAPNELMIYCYLRHIMRRPVFKVSDQVRHKPGFTATEDG